MGGGGGGGGVDIIFLFSGSKADEHVSHRVSM